MGFIGRTRKLHQAEIAANGLTIYSYGTHAAWVNAGILYTVDGNAELAPEQIQKIAASL